MNQSFYTRLLTFIAIVACSLCAAANPQDDRYSVSALGTYGYNSTWSHFGGVEIQATMPINPHFVMHVNAELLSANVYTFSANMQPRFALPVGEMYLDGSFLTSIYQRNRICSYTMAASVGYRMDYVTAQFGFHSLISHDMNVRWHEEANYVVEPFNLLYKIDVRVRPNTSVWNLHLGFANFTELEYERMWQPLFFIGAHYDLPVNISTQISDSQPYKRHLRLLCEIVVKPTGMFHLDASFYGMKAKVGLAYQF